MKILIFSLFSIIPTIAFCQQTGTTATQAEKELLAGDISMQKKNFEDAVSHYIKAINDDKDLTCGYVYRAKAYLGLHKQMEACQDLTTAKSKGCDRPELDDLMKNCEQ